MHKETFKYQKAVGEIHGRSAGNRSATAPKRSRGRNHRGKFSGRCRQPFPVLPGPWRRGLKRICGSCGRKYEPIVVVLHATCPKPN